MWRLLPAASTAAAAPAMYYNATAAAISPCFDNDDLTSSPPFDSTVAARGCGGSFSCAEERSRGQYSTDMHSAFPVAASLMQQMGS